MRWQNSDSREPRIADDRIATFGQDFKPVHITAPDLFTAQVMTRIEAQPSPLVAAPLLEYRLRQGLVVVCLTLVFSLMLMLVSLSVLALFIPTTALMLLGELIGGVVALLSLAHTVSLWLASATASEVLLASLALLSSVAVAIRLGIGRYSTQTPREA